MISLSNADCEQRCNPSKKNVRARLKLAVTVFAAALMGAAYGGGPPIPSCRFEGAKCGYVDAAGKVIVGPEFDWADRFFDRRAVVLKDKKYGAINEKGEIVIPPIYEKMSAFDGGMALFMDRGRIGVVDGDGKTILPALYGVIVRLSNDAFLSARSTRDKDYFGYRHLDSLNSVSIHAFNPTGNKWGVVAPGGAWRIEPKYEQVMPFSKKPSTMFWSNELPGYDGGWRLTRLDGTTVGDGVFEIVGQIDDAVDRAAVRRNGRWGAINAVGEIVIEPKFDKLGAFHNGTASYVLDGEEGEIDANGVVLTKRKVRLSASAHSFEKELVASVDGALVWADKAKTRLLDGDPPQCSDGRRLLFENGLVKIVSAQGVAVPDTWFQYVQLHCDGQSLAEKNGKYGYITRDGKLLARQYFDRASDFYDGVAGVVDNNLWAVIDGEGEFLLGPLKMTHKLIDSPYQVELERGWVRLDKALVAELARDPSVLSRPLPRRHPMSEGLAAQRDEAAGKWGFVDGDGKFLIAPQFDAVGPFDHGVAWAAIPERREWCRIDKAGRISDERSCHCRQPLILYENGDGPPGERADCYGAGVKAIEAFDD
ncbi:hypothetical protein A1351_12280 [Methylosinus sp. R-45379]|uniref:WG repeat-containing protein n=1 Tax=Methylosinus sp. R-45379 TaxID=980563 RepID=UPI0007C9399D|nr:WG repeat-containing protein [Methylosinus sp. R-45379]OAI28061.1 hypothetical protein A1351_12280 [Methylosinus sp. R-45379]